MPASAFRPRLRSCWPQQGRGRTLRRLRHAFSSDYPFVVLDLARYLICDLFPLGARGGEIVEGEVVGQLMGQEGAIEMRDQDFVLVGNVEGDCDPTLCFRGGTEGEVLLMDLGWGNQQNLWARLGAIRGDTHQAGDFEVKFVHLVGIDVAVTKVEDDGVKPVLDRGAGTILNAAEATLEEKRNQEERERQQVDSELG